MLTVFDAIRILRVNHRGINSQQIVVTDLGGKPNAILTALNQDVLEKINIFMSIEYDTTIDDVLFMLSANTPLPEDVLSEYEKILTENVIEVNFATRKNLIEIVVGN
ncbi:hypothetical protein [Pediococcus claussenii]|uniref:Uncharacterized protein n=1 Tax=Pediococcus claussenii (strain ATCC BAA-344 / DSM 14800 / JCM 18046 / KCTC 3811 / LMG 21948 / P06) TaxID=701521 RepID=G8PA82_PEDCP|nr:hypothetical protein [Pediococcus claussenii]AEV94521.1 hypothetical protein PECL_198 [Pediococcus claussenii ATCC BAA-344]ANZ69739.1 hypothetical protein AYR57_05145 [Pediococcus claussenii]ANZ71556.1 hypothetical protein AYR58_05150 [Pediococcus claussenii]KRN19772.1 hypothetical protein IV79_GL001060 [Pediococcus claussenii]